MFWERRSESWLLKQPVLKGALCALSRKESCSDFFLDRGDWNRSESSWVFLKRLVQLWVMGRKGPGSVELTELQTGGLCHHCLSCLHCALQAPSPWLCRLKTGKYQRPEPAGKAYPVREKQESAFSWSAGPSKGNGPASAACP